MIRQDAFDEEEQHRRYHLSNSNDSSTEGGELDDDDSSSDGWEILEKFQSTPYDPPRNLPERRQRLSSSPANVLPCDIDDNDQFLVSPSPSKPKSPISPATTAFNTITHQGFIQLLVLDDDEYLWEDRFAICQPNSGLFVFADDLEANNWKSSSSSYYDQQHLLVQSFAQPGLEWKKQSIDDRFALVLLASTKRNTLCTLAFSSLQERDEWIVALHNARILARFLSTPALCAPQLAKRLLRESSTTTSKLTALEFHGASLGIPFASICSLIKACDLHLLKLALTDSCVENLAMLGELPHSLQELSLENNPLLGDTQFYQFFEVNALSSLQSLHVANCGLGDVTAKLIARYIKTSGVHMVHTIDVARNPQISVLGAYELALVVFDRMERISFAGCDLLQDEFCQVIGMLLNKRTKHLNLANIGMTDAGLESVSGGMMENGVCQCTVDFRNNNELTLAACLHANLQRRNGNHMLFSLLEHDTQQNDMLQHGTMIPLMEIATETSEEELPFDSTLIITCFGFGPMPSYDRMFRFLQGELGSKREIKLFQGELANQLELVILGDFDARCGKHLQQQLKLNGNKYAVFRIDRIDFKPQQPAVVDDVLALTAATPQSPILFLTNAHVSLQSLADAVYDLFFHTNGKLEIVRFQFEGLLQRANEEEKLSPLLVEALQRAVLDTRRIKHTVISAACALEFEEQHAEYDALSHLQLACLRGDMRGICMVCSKLKHSQSFSKRLARLIALRYPVLAAVDEEQEFTLLSEEMVSAKVNVLLLETNMDTFCSQTSELLGRVGRNPLSLHDLHVVLMFRTCQEDVASALEWTLAVTALRLCPPTNAQLIKSLRENYQRCFEETGQEMAQVCCRTLLYLSQQQQQQRSATAVLSVKQRLLTIKQNFSQRTQTITVYLPGTSAVVVECKAFSTFASLLRVVDEKLGAGMGEDVQYRWRGFVFCSRHGAEELLRFEDDPFWWLQRTGSHGAKLYLQHVLPSYFALEADFVDAARVVMLFEQEKRAFAKRISDNGGGKDELTAYLLVLLAIERLGEDRFRFETGSSGLLEMIQAQFPQIPIATLAPQVERIRVGFLACKHQLGNQHKLRSAFLLVCRSDNERWFANIVPEHVCDSGVVMDANALQNLKLNLKVNGFGIGAYFETNLHSSLVEFDYTQLHTLEQDGKWIKVATTTATSEDDSGNSTWMSVKFPTVWEATLFVDLVHLRIWSLLAHGGLCQYDAEFPELAEEEFEFRFKGFPKPPPAPANANRTRARHLGPKVKQSRFHAQILVDQLFRPFGKITPPSCCYAPMESTVFLQSGMDIDDFIELPLTLPPPPQVEDEDTDGEEEEEDLDSIPLPPGPPPPLSDEEEEIDLDSIPLPAGPPPLLPVDSPLAVASPPTATAAVVHADDKKIAEANAPSNWLSANDLQQQKKPKPPKGLSMLEEMKWKQQSGSGGDTSLPEAAVSPIQPPAPKKLAVGNALLESMLAQRTSAAPPPVPSEEPMAAAIILPAVVQQQVEEDPNAKRKAEFLRKKREREAAEAAAALG